MAKRKAGSQSGSLIPNHEKSGIDSTSVCASGVRHTVSAGIPLWAKCEGEAHTPKREKLESSGTPKNSERDCRVQISLHFSALSVIGKVLKCRCPKWPRLSHLDICSPSYGQKKGQESSLEVGNRPVLDMRSKNATWCWKALFEGYKFGSDLVPIRGRGEELRSLKILGVQTETVSGLHFGSPGTKSHSDAPSAD
jgi:hypothetical protein